MISSRNVGTVKMEECQDCPMLHRDYSEARDKCYLEFAGPSDDCTRAGIAHKLDEENTDLRRQVADAKAENERLRNTLDDIDHLLCKRRSSERDAEAQHIIATALGTWERKATDETPTA